MPKLDPRRMDPSLAGPDVRGPRNPRLFSLLFLAVATTLLAGAGLLGWLTAPPEAAAARTDTRPQQRMMEPRRPRVVKLRALGTEVAIDDLKRMSAPAVAAFAAKRWIDLFARAHQREQRFAGRFGGRFSGSVNLDNYFLGWMAVTDQSSTYSNSQLAESLHLELCRRPERERQLLHRAAPTIAALATGPCPVN